MSGVTFRNIFRENEASFDFIIQFECLYRRNDAPSLLLTELADFGAGYFGGTSSPYFLNVFKRGPVYRKMNPKTFNNS